MSNYTKATNFASKDTLPTGNPLKTLSGTEIDDEFSNIQTSIASKANISSPTLTGTPLAPTAATSNNSTQIATTAFAQAAITAGVTSGITGKADLDSPALTGTPTAPTATVGNDTTQIATTAFVQEAIPAALTASDLLTSIKTVDGAGSGLDADTLDGQHASAFLTPTGDGSQLTGISTFELPSQASLTTSTMTGNTNGGYVSLNLGSGGAGWYYFQDFSKGCLLQYAKGWHNDTSDDDGVNSHAWSDTAGIFYCSTTPRLYSLRWGSNNDIYTGGSIKWVKIS